MKAQILRILAACAAVEAGAASLDDAPWIGDGRAERTGADWYDEDPAPEFRAEFVLRPGVTNVTARFACAGYAQVFFSPGAGWLAGLETPWSVYDKTIYSLGTTRNVVPCAPGDVHANMTMGEVMKYGACLAPYPATNSVTVRLGNGFYNLPPLKFWGRYEFRSTLAHGRPCFKFAVDGVEQPLEWKWRRTNVLRNSVYLGAEIDATRPEDTDWKPAAEVRGPRGKIVPWPERHGPRVNCNIAHGRAKWLREGVQVVDFGTNATGVPTFRFRGEERGTRIEIVYGERLNADGSVNVLTQTAGQIKRAGLGGPGSPDVACQRDVYVCRGNEGDRSGFVRSNARYEPFEPPFTWHVFRYAEVRGAKNLLEENVGACRCDVSSVAVPLPAARAFKPRNPVFGEIHQMCTRTFQANLIGAVQSDCPGRERLGYGGDIVATCEAYMLNWDMRTIYLKILRDFADEAEDDGWLTETAPFVGIADRGFGGRSGPVTWAAAVPVLMDALIRHYPDVKDRALAYYPVCARYARLVDAKRPDGIIQQCFGDHEALERAPDAVTATAHWHRFASLTAKFAGMLGKDAEAREFAAIAAKTKAAFAAKFVKDGVVANGTQSAQAIALYLGLVPEGQIPAAEKALVAAVEKAGCAPTTGIFGTRYMLMYLSEHGRVDLAEKIVLHEGFPGWRHMLDRGATTLWETWKESDDTYSNCHPMFGSVDEWLLRFGFCGAGVAAPELPTGCPDFVVDAPRATGGGVVRAVDFGFSEAATNNAGAIMRALAEAKRTGAARVELAPGVYRCHDPHGIVFEGFRDFTFDGKGAELLFQRASVNRRTQHDVDERSANVSIIGCERTVVGNFKMDWDWSKDPLGFWCRPVEFHVDARPNESYVDFDLEKPHPRYPADIPVQQLMPMDESHLGARLELKTTRPPGRYFGSTEGHWGTKSAWLSPTRLRVWPCVRPEGHYIAPDQLERYSEDGNRSLVKSLQAKAKGSLYEILHYYYGMNGFNIVGNSHLTLKDVEIWSCRGFGVQTSGAQHHWQFVNVNLRPRPGSKYPITATADGHHFVQSKGYFKMIDCEVCMNMDDHFNLHDRTQIAWKAGERRVEVVNNRGIAYIDAHPGYEIELRQDDYAETGWTGKIVSIDGEFVTFDRPLPPQKGRFFVLFNNTFATKNILFKGCYFHHTQFSRGLVMGHNMTFENCRFEALIGSPLRFQTCYSYNVWNEGIGCRNIVVRGCRFENCLDSWGVCGVSAQLYTGTRMPWKRDTPMAHIPITHPGLAREVAAYEAAGKRLEPSPDAISGILVEKCAFVNPCGYLWFIMNGDNLKFRDNTVSYDKPSFPILPCSGKIRIEGGTRIDVPEELVDRTVAVDPNRPGGN